MPCPLNQNILTYCLAMNRIRLIAGITIWIVGLSIGGYYFLQAQDRNRQAAELLMDYSAGPGQFVDLHCAEENFLGKGDPIFLLRDDGRYQRVGEIKSITQNDDAMFSPPSKVPIT